MAIFSIIKSKVNTNNKVQFTVIIEEGSIQSGDNFVLYETHHPIAFTVEEIIKDSEHTTLVCSGSLPWEGAYVKHRVDTNNPNVAKLSAYKQG